MARNEGANQSVLLRKQDHHKTSYESQGLRAAVNAFFEAKHFREEPTSQKHEAYKKCEIDGVAQEAWELV